MKKLFKDDFHNTALIETVWNYPNFGANKKELGYWLACFADYNNNFLYFCSVYNTEEAAMEKLKTLSCGTFKEYNIHTGGRKA